ncbi:uncharacterized protein si:ch1073-406l10.2 [Thalassophryne amazonica]|uniref:uncharacterized protein si:ch1073-406l10.2 n=1 Tax=Thalassophryne amazonica TaxID=390379 RepID=UPI00147169BE|nr:uncharacterized protein si:ch1073-406l10.2 [Thalassophryne amazonica]
MESKMTALLLLLSAGALLFSTNAQEGYGNLPEIYRTGVHLALLKIHSHPGIQQHFLFFRSLQKSDIGHGFNVSYVYHNFHLKATKCLKGAANTTACHFRNDRPLIDCAVCYKTYNGQIEEVPKPYVHCIHKPSLTEVMKTTRVQHCTEMTYNMGGPNLLSSSN